jgi:hypothetical protein
MKNPKYDFLSAIKELESAGIKSEPKDYGFCLSLHGSYIQCGHESDGGISISINFGKPPTEWIWSESLEDIVKFLIVANEKFVSGQSSTWSDAIEDTNIDNVEKDIFNFKKRNNNR